MTSIWQSLQDIQSMLVNKIAKHGKEYQESGLERFNNPGWINRVWQGDGFRRAHIDVVDARDSRGLWMMHCCIFPHFTNSGPIFGFDVVAGKNKITGCFHDFSPIVRHHDMLDWFANKTNTYNWKKTRKLPTWATNIFSEHMIAAGNVQDLWEIDQILEIVESTSDYYLTHISNYNDTCENIKAQQDYYCLNQKQNPHTPKVMASLGLNKEDVEIFIQDCLFPEV